MRAEKEKENRDEIFDQYWGKFETEFWSTQVRRGGRSYPRLDLGLRFFLMAKTGNLVDARRVSEEYRHWISATPPRYGSVRDELADFARHCDVFHRFENVPPNTPSVDIRRVVKDLDVSTALPLLIFLELDAGLAADDFQTAIRMLESFLVRRAFVGAETREYNKLFVELIGNLQPISREEMKTALQSQLLSGGGTTRSWPTDEEVIEKAVSRPIARELRGPSLRLILERLELFERGKKSEELVIGDGLQIEHVLPQDWSEHWPLQEKKVPKDIAAFPVLAANGEFAPLADAIRTRNERLHTLGNLSLVNKYLNPAAGNSAFNVKKVEFAQSVLRLNRYFDAVLTWAEEDIAARGKLLGQHICKIWTRPSHPSIG